MKQILWERVHPWLSGSLASRTYWKPIFWGVREAIHREVPHLGTVPSLGEVWKEAAGHWVLLALACYRSLAVEMPHTAKESGEENRSDTGR